MRSKIYKIFTRDNGIILSNEVLLYLESNMKDEETLRMILIEYKRRNGPRIGDLVILKDIIESKTQSIYRIVNQEFKEMNNLVRYKYLRNKMRIPITPIYLLNDTNSNVFGCYYRDKYGKEVLEDDGDIFPVDMKKCDGNVFLCDNMFVGMEGYKRVDEFVVSRIHLPDIEKRSVERPNLMRTNLKMLFFSEFRINGMNGEILGRILKKMPVDVVVIMGRLCAENSSISYSNFIDGLNMKRPSFSIPEIILCPDSNDLYPSFLPKRISVPEEYCKTIKSASNPFVLEVGDCSIGIIRDDVFRSKESGLFIGTDYVDSFVRSVLSQYSFNPFGLPDLSIDRIPDVFVVGQDIHPFIASINDILFVSCPNFKEEMSFVSYDLNSNDIGILNCKDVLC